MGAASGACAPRASASTSECWEMPVTQPTRCGSSSPPARVKALQRAGAEIVRCRADRAGRVDLKDLLRRLAGRGLTSVMVEGGARIHGSFLEGRLWDEVYLFVAPRLAGEGALSWAGF